MSDALASLASLPAAFASLGSALRRPNDSTSRDAVPQPVPIPTQTSLLMLPVPVDNAVANAPDQRLAQPLPLATSAAANPLLLPPSARPEWDPDDLDLLLKSTNRPQFTETSGVRIRAFLENAENFLQMCGRPRDRWARFIISWLGANEAEKVRRSHFFSDDVDYTDFMNGLITLFGRLEFEDSYRHQLRELAQSGSESIASYAARTTDLTTRAYIKFPTELQLDIAVENFIAGLRDTSTRDYLRRERARRSITWQEAVQMTQACELLRASDRSSFHAAIASDTSSATFANSAESTTTSSNNCAITARCASGNTGNPRRRHEYWSSRAPQGDWRAANPGNTAAPPKHLWKFDPMTGAPYGATSNLQAPNTPYSPGNTDLYARTPCFPQPPPAFNSYRQPQPYQHTPCQPFQLNSLQTPSGPRSFDFRGHSSVDGTSAQLLPNTDDL